MSVTYQLSNAYATNGISGATVEYGTGQSFDILAALVTGGGNAKGVGGSFTVTDSSLIEQLNWHPAVKVQSTAGPTPATQPPSGFNVPVWQPYTRYPAGFVVQQSGALYSAKADFTTGASFVASNWNLVVGAKQSLAQGLPLVAARTAQADGNTYGMANAPSFSRIRHTALAKCSDIRLLYGLPMAAEFDGFANIAIKVGLELPGGTVYPVTFRGRQTHEIELGGVILSDPVGVELNAGDIFYTRCFESVPFGPSTTLAAASLVGATTLSLTALPQAPGLVSVDSGGNSETVRIVAYTGSASPYTAILAPGTTCAKAHASGVAIGQFVYGNIQAFSDFTETALFPTSTDYSYSGSPAAIAGSTSTTLQAAANVGDTSIKLNSVPIGPATGNFQLTVDTGGVQETVTVRTVGGTAAPYTAYLTAPLANAHVSGVAVTSAYGNGAAFAPMAIVADRTSGSVPKTIAAVGDSIPNGTGYNFRLDRSFFTLAFEGVNPYVNVTRAGEAASQFATSATSYRRRRMLTLADWALYEYGVNDIYSGATLAQVQASAQTIWGWLKQRGLKVAVTTLTPRTTSTDGWTTVTNQALVSGGANAVRVQYNDWLRANAGSLGIDLLIELANVVEVNSSGVATQDGGLWKADASGPYTADGIHPTSAGHALFAAAINPALFI